MSWIDISIPIHPGMLLWPGDPGIQVNRSLTIAAGDGMNLTRLAMSAHTGTHMDAPLHFVEGGAAMDTLPLDAVLGSCRVIGINDPVAVRPAELPDDLAPGDRILFKTANSSCRWWMEPFRKDFVYISKKAAEMLVEAGVQTVGIDYLSVDAFDSKLFEAHQTLLSGGVWIIEGLDLTRIAPGEYELACLPLKIVGSDGAPVRAALRPR